MEDKKMKGLAKAPWILMVLLMAILTVIYASAVAYANVNSHPYPHQYVAYAAFEYRGDTPPTEWYTPEQLGIYDVTVYEENYSFLHIAVDREKEPFPLQEKQPVFLYKDKFYRVSQLWATPGLPESVKQWQFPIAGLLGIGWISTGILFIWRKKE